MFQSQLTGSEKHRYHPVSAHGVKAQSAAATNRFIIGVRGDYQNVHVVTCS